jgi:hypothetical protein
VAFPLATRLWNFKGKDVIINVHKNKINWVGKKPTEFKTGMEDLQGNITVHHT